MITRVYSAAIHGVEAALVQVEVDLLSTLPIFTTVGLAEGAVKESKERVRSAIKNAGYAFPARRITVNLAPADMRKVGTGFDLPIAVGILLETGVVSSNRLDQWLLAGELSLDGQLRPIQGALPMTIAAQRAGLAGVILPSANALEAMVVSGVEVRVANTLGEVASFLNDEEELPLASSVVNPPVDTEGEPMVDMSDVAGQSHAKRALEVAAAGGHNLLMLGPPGSGKSMLARRLTSILPTMSFEERLEASMVYSVLGLIAPGRSLLEQRPFRAPHHTVSDAGLVGGGPGPSPGEVSLAHHGVLFLDELPEFRRQSLEVLRQPLEDGHVTLVRARGSLTYPARFMLVATMNPCPCGHLGDRVRECTCGVEAIARYRGRISGPLLDRIDLHIEVPALPWSDLRNVGMAEPSESIRQRVETSRQRQLERYRALGLKGVHCNAQLPPGALPQMCPTSAEARRLLEGAMEKLGLSARAYARILKVARTLADLEEVPRIEAHHIAEAVQYRTLDRQGPLAPSRPTPAAPIPTQSLAR